MKASVIIPNYKHYNLLHQLLFDLYQNCKADIDEVLVVDDASNDKETENGLAWWFSQQMLPLHAIWKQENEGFLKTCNLGAKRAEGDIVILLSTDVRVKSNFVRQIKDLLDNDDKILIGNRLIDWNSGWNTFNGRIFPYLEGWLIACTKEIWNELGGFYEEYGSSDYEDIHISTAAKEKGYTLVSLNNDKITHIGGQSYGFNPARETRTKRNKEIFKAFWLGEDE